MNFSFGHPALAAGLAAALLPLAVHLFFRRRPKPLAFPAIDFVLRARRQTERRLRLRRVLLFSARTLLAAALAAALARPRLDAPATAAAAGRGPAATAIVLDASASLRYRAGRGALFDRAKADAIAALDGLASGEPATALVCGGPAPAPVPAPSFDRASVRRLLAAAEVTAGPADLTACIAAAARALSGPGPGAALAKRIAVATDLAASSWRLDAPPPQVEGPRGPERPDVTLLDASRGAAMPNLAITGLTAEPDAAAGPRSYRITATLAAYAGAPGGPRAKAQGAGARDVELQLHAGGATAPVVLRSYVRVEPGAVLKKTLSWAFPQGGPAALTATLAPADALDVDDARAITVAVPRDVRVLVVRGAPSPLRWRDEAFFVEAALASPASPVRPTVIDAESFPKARLTDYDVVFLLDVRTVGPRAAELRTFVERGGGLFLAMGDAVDPDLYDQELGDLLPRRLRVVKTAGAPSTGGGADPARPGAPGRPAAAARFVDVDWEHPALRPFTGVGREGFEGVRTQRYMLLEPAREGRGADARVLVSYDDGAPALVEARRGAGRVMLYTSTVDRSWSDWPIRTSFLPAIQRIASWLGGGLTEARAQTAQLFERHPLAAPEGTRVLAAVGPDGRDHPLAAPRAGEREAAPAVVPDEPGLWGARTEEKGEAKLDPRLAFAVPPDAGESDTTRLDPQELTAWLGGAAHAQVAGDGVVGAREIPLWSVLLLIGLVALLAESALLA